MSRRKSFIKRRTGSTEMSLQITSMADIFMILLVFLLKGYSSDAFTVSPSAGTSLPATTTSVSQASPSLKVEVSQDAVLLDGRLVANMKKFRFESGDVDGSGVSRSLLGALNKERALESAKKNANEGGSPEGDARLMVLADQRAPYQTIKTVLASAAMQGYTDIRLAVVHAE